MLELNFCQSPFLLDHLQSFPLFLPRCTELYPHPFAASSCSPMAFTMASVTQFIPNGYPSSAVELRRWWPFLSPPSTVCPLFLCSPVLHPLSSLGFYTFVLFVIFDSAFPSPPWVLLPPSLSGEASFCCPLLFSLTLPLSTATSKSRQLLNLYLNTDLSLVYKICISNFPQDFCA